MSDTRYIALGDVVADELFPDVDLALRRGRHVDREDQIWYTFLVDAQALLEAFYRRFGCELMHPADGYFYLLPTADKLGRRHLSVPEMLVGQALTLLYLDPATLEHGGVIQRADALSHLAAVMGSDALTRAFNPKRKRLDERVAQETVRGKFAEALRRLAALGFVDLLESDALRLRPGLLRFAEPVRGRGSPAEALERLVARGELVLGDGTVEVDELGDLSDESENADEGDDADEDGNGVAQPPSFELPREVLSEFADFGEDVSRPQPLPTQDFAELGEAPPPHEPLPSEDSVEPELDPEQDPPPLEPLPSEDFADFGEEAPRPEPPPPEDVLSFDDLLPPEEEE